jgi:hypothetical protein
MPQVPTVRTTADAQDVLAALQEGGVTPGCSIFLAAQSDLETEAWRKMFCWNLGNITVASTEPWMHLASNPLHFGAYGSLAEGVRAFLDYLAKKELLPLAEAGRLDPYVAKLKSTYYAGSDPSVYYTYKWGMKARIARLSSPFALARYSPQ